METTKKQTDWSHSVWAQWASCCFKNLIESDEFQYELDETPLSMTKKDLLFWLPKFIDEVRNLERWEQEPLQQPGYLKLELMSNL